MTVPEASVDEDHSIACGKNEIRVAREIAAMERVAETQPVDHATDRHFGLGVLATDAPHHGAALRWREGVHYQKMISSARSAGKVRADLPMSKFIFLLTAPLAAAAFANAKDLPVQNIVPGPPSICDAASGNLLTDCGLEGGFTAWAPRRHG